MVLPGRPQGRPRMHLRAARRPPPGRGGPWSALVATRAPRMSGEIPAATAAGPDGRWTAARTARDAVCGAQPAAMRARPATAIATAAEARVRRGMCCMVDGLP